ncbi:MAG TPA: hypothetical protein VF434_15660 [Promineifilum sp.]
MRTVIKLLWVERLVVLAVAALLAPSLLFRGERTATPPLQSTDPTPDPRFGIIEAFWKADEAAELDVGWDRILFYWNEIQPAGPDDWNTLHVLEEWLDDAKAEDRMVMGLLKNTPAWATDGAPNSGVPRGLYLPVDDPDNLWAQYVRKVVEYYAPLGVHHWIVWNEPEISAGVYGHEFAGSTEDYYQLLKVASQVAKEHDPLAVIHLAGWSYWHDPGWLDDFLRVATADPEGRQNNYFFDVITLHIYFRVETVEELVNETWKIQDRFDIRKPIWINETNASPNLDPLWPVERPDFQVSLEQQAWYIVQAHALGFGAKSAHIGVYKLLDILLPPGGESFGILRPDGSRRPAFDAYRTTIRYLGGFIYPVGRQQEDGFYVFTFNRSESVTRVLWARDTADVVLRVPALTDEGKLISATGEVQRIRSLNGNYRIRLGGAVCLPNCDIGGPPVFLVEEVAEKMKTEDVPTIDPSVSMLLTPTPAATPSTADGTGPTAVASPTRVATHTPAPTNTPTTEPTATALASPTKEPSATSTSAPEPAVVEATSSATPDAALAMSIPTPLTNESRDTSVLPSSAGTQPGQDSIVSWLFIASAVVLAGLLTLIIVRQR